MKSNFCRGSLGKNYDFACRESLKSTLKDYVAVWHSVRENRICAGKQNAMNPFPENVVCASCFYCAFVCPLYCSLPDILVDGIAGPL